MTDIPLAVKKFHQKSDGIVSTINIQPQFNDSNESIAVYRKKSWEKYQFSANAN